PWGPSWSPLIRRAALEAALGVALVLLAQRLAVGAGARRSAPVLLVTVVAADLALAAWPHLVFTSRQIATTVPPAAAAIAADHQGRPDVLGRPRLYRADRVEVTVRRGIAGEGERPLVLSLVPNTSTTFGVAAVPGYDAAIPEVLRQLWTTG